MSGDQCDVLHQDDRGRIGEEIPGQQ
jgi:hypothetical protein